MTGAKHRPSPWIRYLKAANSPGGCLVAWRQSTLIIRFLTHKLWSARIYGSYWNEVVLQDRRYGMLCMICFWGEASSGMKINLLQLIARKIIRGLLFFSRFGCFSICFDAHHLPLRSRHARADGDWKKVRRPARHPCRDWVHTVPEICLICILVT